MSDEPLAPEPSAPESTRPDDLQPPHSRREALLLFAGCLLVFWAVGAGRRFASGVVAELLPALGVMVWIVPAYVFAERRGHDPFRVHGLFGRPKGVAPAVLVSVGLLLAYVLACWGWFGVHLGRGAQRIDWGALWGGVPWQLIFVALPEEYFFRGVLQPALEEPPQLTILGAPVGRGVVLAAGLFAIAHLDPAQPDPIRLLTFFPALWFGWLRARTGSILPAIVAHALANLVQQGCARTWGGAIG